MVGSGPSCPYIAPIQKLELDLSAVCNLVKEPDEKFWVFAERAYDSNPEEYFRLLRSTYDETPHWSSRIYGHLAAIRFRGYATFNYDDQLPSEMKERYGDALRFSVYPPRPGQTYFTPSEFRSGIPTLVALHGYCDPAHPNWEKEIILRASDYNEHYTGHRAPLFDWWRELLLSFPCIFVGTSLQEPGLHRVMEYLVEGHYDRLIELKHIHLINAESDSKTGEVKPAGKSLTVVEQLLFEKLDSRYSGLIQVLGEFSGLPCERPSPRSPAPKPITHTDTFEFRTP